nr:choice-of-anchor J domain-containing protein [uncultured Fluviicola sp.]
MKARILKTAALCGLFALGSISKYNAQSFSESFNDITTLAGNDWVMTNASVAVGSTNWFQGNPVGAGGPFDSYNGATNAYIGANYNNTGSTGTISNWLMTPNRTFRNGDVITFYTRKPSPDTYADRLEVRLSTNGASTSVGTGSAVGDYTTLLLSVNPSLVLGVYPTTWTMYTITISGLPAPTSGRIAFRYFVTSAGLSGTNSDYIGIDQVDYTPYVCPSFTMTPGGALTGGVAGSAYSLALTQTGALGAPNYAVTAGALPPGLTLSTSGTISGTPTATGTFNYTVTVSDASGCSGSQSYSITVVCPANPITFATAPALCDNTGNYTLIEGSPAGGTYSGTGVTGSDFDPMSGTQTITYDYTDPYGCAFNSNYTITVNNAPVVSLAPISAVCDNSGTLALTGESPAGGTFSGTGVTGSDFDPMAGTQTVTYTYTDANGCSNNTSTTIMVNPSPTVTQSAISPVCSNASPVALTGGSPSGGMYSGTGVNASGDFDPSAGTQTITYTYTDANNCSNAATTDITVNPAPTVSFTSPVSTMCINHAPLTLSGGSPAGGTYSGMGVSAGVLDPAAAGAGDHVITYSYTDANGCDGEAMFTIHVDACLGLTENGQEFGLEIYPNPTTGMFTARVTSGADFSILNVVDIQGKAIQFGSSNSSAQTIDVDFSNQAPGMYFVTGLVDGQQVTFRVQKH